MQLPEYQGFENEPDQDTNQEGGEQPNYPSLPAQAQQQDRLLMQNQDYPPLPQNDNYQYQQNNNFQQQQQQKQPQPQPQFSQNMGMQVAETGPKKKGGQPMMNFDNMYTDAQQAFIRPPNLGQINLISNQPINTLVNHPVIGYYQPLNINGQALQMLGPAQPLKYESDARPFGACCIVCGIFCALIAVILALANRNRNEKVFAMQGLGIVAFITLIIGLCLCCKGKTTIIFDRNVNTFFRQKVSFSSITDKVDQKLTDIVGIQASRKDITVHVKLTVKEYRRRHLPNNQTQRDYVGSYHRYYDEQEIHYLIWILFRDGMYIDLWDLLGGYNKDVITRRYNEIMAHLGVQPNMVWVQKYGERYENRSRDRDV